MWHADPMPHVTAIDWSGRGGRLRSIPPTPDRVFLGGSTVAFADTASLNHTA